MRSNSNTVQTSTSGRLKACFFGLVPTIRYPKFFTYHCFVDSRSVSVRTLWSPRERINVDNGTEFTSKALDHWAYWNGVALDFSRPGKPTDNAHVEAFHGTLRRECLSQHWFADLEDAIRTLEAWRMDYNNHRPHSALGQLPPAEFRAGGDFTQGRIGPLNSQA